MESIRLAPAGAGGGGGVLLLTAAAFLLPARAVSQPNPFVWQRQLGTVAEQIQPFPRMIRCRAGGYVITASINDTTVVYQELASLITKLDEQGRTVWQRRIRPGDAYLVAENGEGQLLIARSGSRYPPDTFPHLTLLETNGQVLWDYQQFLVTTDLRTGNDGRFVGTARERRGSNSYIFKMDSAGADVWRRAVPAAAGSTREGTGHILPVGNGYIVNKYSYLPASGWIAQLVKVDENGIEQYRKPGMLAVNQSQVGADGALLFARYSNKLSKATAQGDTLWTRTYGVRAVCGQADGSILMLGETTGGSSPSTSNSDLTLRKVAPNGDLIKDTVYTRPIGNETPQDIVVDPLGNYVICASSSTGTHLGAAVFVFKVRPWLQALGTADDAPTELALYPNPATEVVRLRRGAAGSGTAQVVLRDALGREVRTYSIDASAGDAPLSLVGLVPGLYLLSVTTNTTTGPATRTWRVLKQ